MSALENIVIYRPGWTNPSGGRVPGLDEDVLTMAVTAGRAALAGGASARRVVVVTRKPDLLDGGTEAVLTRAIGLSADVPVEFHLGGGPSVLDALVTADSGTLVIGVDPEAPAAATAALTGDQGGKLTSVGRDKRMIPVSVQHAREPEPHIYDDPRLVRERGWKPAAEHLIAGRDGALIVTGTDNSFATKLGGADRALQSLVPEREAAAPLVALAVLAEKKLAGRVVAMDGGIGSAVDLRDGAAIRVIREERRTNPAPAVSPGEFSGEIPISLPAFERAFDAKIGLVARRCACGELSHPPRHLCPRCRRTEAGELFALPRSGEVYTVTTIRTPIPGLHTPYSLAVVSLDGVRVRVLGPVTDAPAGTVRIGVKGKMVLRKIADRQGVPDYGYAFQPEDGVA